MGDLAIWGGQGVEYEMDPEAPIATGTVTSIQSSAGRRGTAAAADRGTKSAEKKQKLVLIMLCNIANLLILEH